MVGPALLSAQCFGKSWSGSDGVWWRLEHTLPLPSKYTVFIYSKSAFYCKIELHITVIVSETHPCPQHAYCRIIPQSHYRGCCQAIYACHFSHAFRWWSDQLCCRSSVLGKVGRAQTEFGGGWSTHCHCRQNIQFLFSQKSAFYGKIKLHMSPNNSQASSHYLLLNVTIHNPVCWAILTHSRAAHTSKYCSQCHSGGVFQCCLKAPSSGGVTETSFRITRAS